MCGWVKAYEVRAQPERVLTSEEIHAAVAADF